MHNVLTDSPRRDQATESCQGAGVKMQITLEQKQSPKTNKQQQQQQHKKTIAHKKCKLIFRGAISPTIKHSADSIGEPQG